MKSRANSNSQIVTKFQTMEVEITFDKHFAKCYSGYVTHFIQLKSHRKTLFVLFPYFTYKILGYRSLKSLIHGTQPVNGRFRIAHEYSLIPIVFIPHTTKNLEREKQVFLSLMLLRDPKPERPLGVVRLTMLSSERCPDILKNSMQSR